MIEPTDIHKIRSFAQSLNGRMESLEAQNDVADILVELISMIEDLNVRTEQIRGMVIKRKQMTGLTLIDRLQHFEDHSREIGDMYGAEVLYHALQEIKALRDGLIMAKEELVFG